MSSSCFCFRMCIPSPSDVIVLKRQPLLSTLPDVCVKYEDTLPFVVPITGGCVVKVYDGDTITVASKLPYPDSPMYRFSVRINGIDCPEMKSKDKDEVSVAKIAQQEMTKLVMGKMVELKNVGNEKWGRVLADVVVDGLNVSEYMLEHRLAVKYTGQTKISPKNWTDYHITGKI